MTATFWIVIPVAILFLAALMLARMATFGRKFEPALPVEGAEVDAEKAAEHLAALIRCPTISIDESTPAEGVTFMQLRHTLEELYPRVHAELRCERISDYSLLYIWPGTQPDLPGIVLAAHLDVVPVDPAGAAEWEHEPFSGDIADGYVWGRGALDVKNQVAAILDAAEMLLGRGYQPERTLYFAFGHDEEIGGRRGAQEIVAWLEANQCPLEAVLDEGGTIITGMLPGVSEPVALVGVGEKGHLTLELTVNAAPGHSSQPPSQTAVGILSRAVTRLEENQMPARTDMVYMLFHGVGRAAPLGMQMAFANLWLLGGVIKKVLAARPSTNATIRTTTAPTMIHGGIKSNILPSQAKAVINFRILQGDTIASVCEHVRKVIADERVTFLAMEGGAWEASPISPDHSPAFNSLERTIRQMFGNIPVAPYLVLGATDSRYYAALCPQVYRFSPVSLQTDDLARMHGNNERIAVAAVGRMVQFYLQLIPTWAGEAAPAE